MNWVDKEEKLKDWITKELIKGWMSRKNKLIEELINKEWINKKRMLCLLGLLGSIGAHNPLLQQRQQAKHNNNSNAIRKFTKRTNMKKE